MVFFILHSNLKFSISSLEYLIFLFNILFYLIFNFILFNIYDIYILHDII